MIKILSNEQIRAADKATMEKEGIDSLTLMERAAGQCANWILNHVQEGIGFLIVCGQGNNGGDGLAIARMLWQKGKIVRVVVINDTGKPSPCFSSNLKNWESLSGESVKTLASPVEITPPGPTDIIIDAIFGSGLNRRPEGIAAETIKWLNNTPNRILSIDLPSGLYGDRDTTHTEEVIRAFATLSFQAPRPSFFYPEYAEFLGDWQILDIGLDTGFIKEAPSYGFVTEAADIAQLLPSRPAFGHKGTFGHALLLAGSYGKAGAAILAAEACLRSGTGLVTVRTPASCVVAIQSAAPEAMVSVDPEDHHLGENLKAGTPFTAIGIGPGIGTGQQTGNVLKRIIQDFDAPMVLDADALNLIADNPTWMSFLPAGAIMTPHPGEFARLAGKISDPFERTRKQIELAKRYNCFIILKGKFSCIACPDGQLFFNPTGNNGMAKAGSGDVLTGLVTGLLAQGIAPMKAALAGTYIHGLAGDLAALQMHPASMTSRNLIDYFSMAYNEVTALK